MKLDELLGVSKTIMRDTRSRINTATTNLTPFSRMIVNGRLAVALRVLAAELEQEPPPPTIGDEGYTYVLDEPADIPLDKEMYR